MRLDAGVAELGHETLLGMTRGLEIIAARRLDDPEDVRDAVQETLARALEAIRQERLPPGVCLGAFVYGIAGHVITDVLRQRARERRAPHAWYRLGANDPTPLELLVRAEDRARVQRALGQLSEADRKLLTHCFVNGERVVDIAKRLSEPAERVRQRKSRALKRLRALLDGASSSHVSADTPTTVA